MNVRATALWLCAVLCFAFLATSPALGAGRSITVPYASTDGSWWTGVAVNNLDDSEATGEVTIAFYNEKGIFIGKRNVGPIAPHASYVAFASDIYKGGKLPSRYKMVISHPKTQEIAATVFLGNGGEGFAYQNFISGNDITRSERVVDALPFTISTPGLYYLTEDLTCPEGTHGITVEADDVTLDLRGFSLVGPGSGGLYRGVHMREVRNFEIRNGTIRNFTRDGIYSFDNAVEGVSHRVTNMRVVGNGGTGIFLYGDSHYVAECTVLSNGGSGIICSASTIVRNVCSMNAQEGIDTSFGSVVAENTCRKNGFSGIKGMFGVTIMNNSCSDNTYHGIFAYGGCTVKGNSCYSNGESGIKPQDNCLVIDNTAYGNQKINFESCQSCTFDRNHGYLKIILLQE